MGKILVQGYICGHDITLRKDPCFLVKNKLPCSDEERKQVRKSKRSCNGCLKQQRKLPIQGRVPPAVEREEPRDPSQPFSKYSAVAKAAAQDPSTIIANLKALCAKVVVEKRAIVIPTSEQTKSSQIGPKHLQSEVSIARKESATLTDRKTAAAAQDQTRVRKAALTDEGGFFDFMDEMDDLALKPHISMQPVDPNVRRCQGDHRRSGVRRQPWTRDNWKTAVSLGSKDQLHYHARLDSQLSRLSADHRNSPLSRKPQTGPDKEEAESISSRSCARRPLP